MPHIDMVQKSEDYHPQISIIATPMSCQHKSATRVGSLLAADVQYRIYILPYVLASQAMLVNISQYVSV